MAGFADRIAASQVLVDAFMNGFNETCSTHRIVQFGVESTEVRDLHEHIRHASDQSSRFVRYLPDSVLVRTRDGANAIGPKTCLIEYKVQNTLIRSDRFFSQIQSAYGTDNDLALTEKDQVFAVERDALMLYKAIQRLGVVVIVVGWQGPTRRLRVQHVEEIIVCHEHTPRAGGAGSGTPESNTHFDSYREVGEFFASEFGIERDVMAEIYHVLTNR